MNEKRNEMFKIRIQDGWLDKNQMNRYKDWWMEGIKKWGFNNSKSIYNYLSLYDYDVLIL